MSTTVTAKRIYTRAEIVNGTGWPNSVLFAGITEGEMNNLMHVAQGAADAANGDSNDEEIEALRDALDLALHLLGLTMPEPTEED